MYKVIKSFLKKDGMNDDEYVFSYFLLLMRFIKRNSWICLLFLHTQTRYFIFVCHNIST